MKIKTRRLIFWGAMTAILIFIAVPAIHLTRTHWQETGTQETLPPGFTDDASHLNRTRIDTLISLSPDTVSAHISLRNALELARKENQKIALAGARHSMGGQTIAPHGIVIDMLAYHQMHLDKAKNELTIGSGALWEDAIAFLDKEGKSIAVMQAFSSFSIGGSLSVNGHGWQKNSPPVASSVISFTLMGADGRIRTCSRTQNAELFRLVLGGYGLFGIILEVKLRVVDNKALEYRYLKMSPENYVLNYKKYVLENPDVELAFGRLRISDKNFLEEAVLNFFQKTDAPIHRLEQQKASNQQAKRLVFRGSVGSEYGKRLRWDLERGMSKVSRKAVFSRNELLDDHVSLIENKDPASTDLLQEYFIPERNFNQYLKDIKPILQHSGIDLLNITIRAVAQDQDSYLNYAREDVFGFVYLFNQKKTAAEEKKMQRLTVALTQIAIKNQGTFYLPYRLHIPREMMRECYPQADSVFALKKKYDPQEIFSNKFYLHYR